MLAILAAALAGISNAFVASRGDNAQREAANTKAETDRLLEAIKPEDEKTRALKLEFLRKVGLVSDKDLAAASTSTSSMSSPPSRWRRRCRPATTKS